MATKPKVAVHKFSSCDGCQLAFLNLGEDLLTLTEQVEIVHFAEAGPVDEDTPVDIAFVEGSIATPDDLPRIERIRRNSRYLISIGACATSGGIQALRNMADTGQWIVAIYASPEFIHSLDTSTAIARHVRWISNCGVVLSISNRFSPRCAPCYRAYCHWCSRTACARNASVSRWPASWSPKENPAWARSPAVAAAYCARRWAVPVMAVMVRRKPSMQLPCRNGLRNWAWTRMKPSGVFILSTVMLLPFRKPD